MRTRRQHLWVYVTTAVGIIACAVLLFGDLLPDLHLAHRNKRAQENQALIDEYFWASHVDDIPADERTVFQIVWHGSNAENREGTQVTSLHVIGLNGLPEDSNECIVLWVDASSTVQHAVVCALSPDNLQPANDMVSSVAKLLGTKMETGIENERRVIPEIDTSSFYGVSELYSREHWQESRRLVRGDRVSVPPDASLFVREVTIVRPGGKGILFFYWFADSQGQILQARMICS